MSEMVDRIVDVLRRLPVRDLANTGGELDELRLREAARAAIEAMRHPTDEMVIAAHECDAPPIIMWPLMIDEALKD